MQDHPRLCAARNWLLHNVRLVKRSAHPCSWLSKVYMIELNDYGTDSVVEVEHSTNGHLSSTDLLTSRFQSS